MNNDLIFNLASNGDLVQKSNTIIRKGSASYYKLTVESDIDIQPNEIMYINFRRMDGAETSILGMTRISGTNSFYLNLNSDWYFYISGELRFNLEIRKIVSDIEVIVRTSGIGSINIETVVGFNKPAPVLPKDVDLLNQKIVDLQITKIDQTELDTKVDKSITINDLDLSQNRVLDGSNIKVQYQRYGSRPTGTLQGVLDDKLIKEQLIQEITEEPDKIPSSESIYNEFDKVIYFNKSGIDMPVLPVLVNNSEYLNGYTEKNFSLIPLIIWEEEYKHKVNNNVTLAISDQMKKGDMLEIQFVIDTDPKIHTSVCRWEIGEINTFISNPIELDPEILTFGTSPNEIKIKQIPTNSIHFKLTQEQQQTESGIMYGLKFQNVTKIKRNCIFLEEESTQTLDVEVYVTKISILNREVE